MKAIMLGILAVFVVGMVAAGTYAFGGNGFRGNDAMKDALETGDYDAFIDSVETGDKPFMAQHMTEERFNERVLQYQVHEEIRAAVEADDYEAWSEAMAKLERAHPMAEQITEENWDTFVEMHNARMDQDFETANALADELGFEPGQHKGMRSKGMLGMGDGMQKGIGRSDGGCRMS
ncbi:MAG: hypothetical protein KKG59_07720 [Nanoarchaeota archaeon]|nr:hypothetical protein [Nanoarchaeota archaeon]